MMVPAHKLEIWPGYVNRVTECDGGLMLVCDTRNKVLRLEFLIYNLLRMYNVDSSTSPKNIRPNLG